MAATATTRKKVGLGDFPRISRFYGIPPRELIRTPNWLIEMYAEELDELQAEERLGAMQVSDYPHMETGARQRIHEQWLYRAGYTVEPEKIDVSTDDGRDMARSLGIAVKVGDD